MSGYETGWILQKIREWEAVRDQADTQTARDRAERELQYYRQWLNRIGGTS